MIRPCGDADFDASLAVINGGPRAYIGSVPAPLLHEPYMPAE